MIGKILNIIRVGIRTLDAPRPPRRGLARDLLRLHLGGPPGVGDQVLETLLLRDPPRQGCRSDKRKL